ncbi:hypothetical protein QQZ08_003368 [Neonectria magnoliae]|uniref:Cytochrome P450 n=1 Tax=Neonectria magnoliae TaxID=2732573 RepID=A0ABR1I9B4_9HYPO
MGLLLRLNSSPSPSLFLAVLLGLIAITIAHRVQRGSRLRHIPGPRLAYGRPSGSSEKPSAVDTMIVSSPLVRMGPNELLSTDPDVLWNMSAVRSEYTKGDFYTSGRIVPGVDNVVSTRDEAKHKAMRAKMAPGVSTQERKNQCASAELTSPEYSGKENEGFGFEPGMDRQLLNFLALLDRKYISTDAATRPVDLAEKTQFFALDAIGDVSLGEPFGYLARDEDLYNYNEINASSLPVMNVVSALPWLTQVVHRWPLCLVLPREGDQVGFGRLMGFARNFVKGRLAADSPPVKDMIIAGSNSSAQVLRMTILSLITNPTAYASLISEIRHSAPFLSAPFLSTPIAWTETQTLPYLQAVVREGLRMWPPVGGPGLQASAPRGRHRQRLLRARRAQIGQGFYAVGRSRLVWGEDADVFRPERWLIADGDELRRMVAALDTHFGHGKYSCLGKPIALMEIHKAVYELMKRYDFAVLNTEQPIKTMTSVFWFASDFWVRITKGHYEGAGILIIFR